MSRTKFFVNNSIAMAIQQLVNVVVAFILPRFLITAYGSEVNGLIVSITQFISYFILVEAGISGASVYALYKPLADKNIESINSILSASRKFYLKSGYIFLILITILALSYPLFVNVLSLSNFQIAIIVFCIGTAGTMDFFTLSKYRVLLTADQKSYVISVATIVSSIIKIILVIIFALYKLDIVWLQIFLVLSVFSRSIILLIYTKSHYSYLNFTVKPDYDAVKDRWNVLYLQLLGSSQVATPIVIATIFTSLYQVSVYSIYNMIIGGIGGILGIFISGLAASFGDVIAKNEIKTLQKSHQEFELFYYMIITIVYSAALLLVIPFVQLYTKGVNDVNYIIPTLSFLFVFNGLLYNIKTPQGMLVIAAGMYKQTKWQSTIQALLILLIALPLAPFFGLYGILIGLICSNIYRDIDLLFFIPKYVTKLSYKFTLKRILLVLFNFSIAAVVFLFIEIQCASFTDWIIYATLITSVITIWVLLTNILIDKKNIINIYLRIKKLI